MCPAVSSGSRVRSAPRRAEAAPQSVTVSDVLEQEVVELAIGGRSISTLFFGERRFDIHRFR
jgi:Cu/Ag efflux pump CusA